MATTRITELAAIITSSTEHIDAHFAAKGLPSPSFEPDRPISALLDVDITASRQAILNATDELHALIQGPVEMITRQPKYNSWISLQAIAKFGLASAFPVGKDEATFAKIAENSGLAEVHVRRLLRHAMTFRIFQEPREGVVRHTAASNALADSPLLRQWVGMMSEELWPAATKTVDALTKWPKCEEPNNAGYNLAHNTTDTIFDEITKYPDRDQRYADAMTYTSTGPGREPHHILKSYDWASLGSSTVVDVGGSHGSLSFALARTFPSLRFVVQDRPQVIAIVQENVPLELHDRVSFMAHDFFTEQPVKDADVFILKFILHDWSDKYAAMILQALVPALRDGTKVVVLEQILPVTGEMEVYQERACRYVPSSFDLGELIFGIGRSTDLTMWATHNGRERELGDWKDLFRMAGPGYEITNVISPEGSRLSIIEATWRDMKTVT
ncbi:MAG: hypothetical protein Q9170_003062 [Blastenia crenularia]